MFRCLSAAGCERAHPGAAMKKQTSENVCLFLQYHNYAAVICIHRRKAACLRNQHLAEFRHGTELFFTYSARSGALQWEITSRLEAVSPPFFIIISAIF